MEDLSKTSTVKLINDMAQLDELIELKIIEYNDIVREITRRFPSVSNSEEFKPKTKRRCLRCQTQNLK